MQAEPAPTYLTPQLTAAQGSKYRCGDCGRENQLKMQDPVRCKYCGFRVLYKIRTNRMIQFEAR